MAERIPNGVAKLVVFRAHLASDHITPATGKTIAITISKNGAILFSNPAAGATNATEMASGFYKFTLATGDIDTNGPLAFRAAAATIDDVGDVFEVISASVNQTGDAFARIGVDGAGLTAIGDTRMVNLDAAITSRQATGAMTLTAGERNSVADALLDRADAIEIGLTLRQAHRLESAAAAGKLSGAATNTVIIRNAVADAKARITATVDADGNRSAITTDVI